MGSGLSGRRWLPDPNERCGAYKGNQDDGRTQNFPVRLFRRQEDGRSDLGWLRDAAIRSYGSDKPIALLGQCLDVNGLRSFIAERHPNLPDAVIQSLIE